MLGLFAMGLSFMRGAAVVTILGVLVVMAASITLFPALLGYLGRHVDRLRLPLGPRRTGDRRRRRARRAVARLAALEPARRSGTGSSPRSPASSILLALAAPFLGVRFGFPDAGNNREETIDPAGLRHASPTASAPGANGPLLLVAELPAGGGDAARCDRLAAARCASTPGVAAVTPAPAEPGRRHRGAHRRADAPARRTPRTEDLVAPLRDDVLPGATAGTGVDRPRRRRDRDLDRQHRTTSPSGSRCSSAAWCCCRCCCCWCRSAASRSRSRRPS